LRKSLSKAKNFRKKTCDTGKFDFGKFSIGHFRKETFQCDRALESLCVGYKAFLYDPNNEQKTPFSLPNRFVS